MTAPRACRVVGANGSDAGAVPQGCGEACGTGDVARVPTKTCPQCARVFERRPEQWASTWTKQKFCSRRCSATFYSDERIAQVNAGRARALADPGRLEDYRERTRTALAKVRPLANQARTRNSLAGIPPEYQEQYRHLVYDKRLGIERSRAIIRQQIAADARRIIDRITREMHDKRAREQRDAY